MQCGPHVRKNRYAGIFCEARIPALRLFVSERKQIAIAIFLATGRSEMGIGMRSEQIERIKIWLDILKRELYTPVAEVKWCRMTTYDNLGFEKAMSIIKARQSGKDTGVLAFEDERDGAWGRKWEYGWFYGEIDIASVIGEKRDTDIRGRRLELIPDVGGEMLISVNGKLAGSRDLQHEGITLSRSIKGDEKYEILIESYAGHGPRLEHAGPAPFGVAMVPEPPMFQQREGKSYIAVCNEETYKLYIDALTLWQLYGCLDERSLRAQKILKALFEFTRIADPEAEPKKRKESYVMADKVLQEPLSCVNGSTAPVYTIFGQSHLDLAWKWTWEETRRKCGRTYSTQLSLMEDYEDYKFLGCEPYIFESIKKDYPELYGRILERVKSGNIIPEGGMYVEGDTNIPSGESLIRQCIYGRKWFKENFNADSVMLWLPDCFGFPGQLPQIMKGCGLKYFATQKLSRALEGAEVFPYNNFYWEGIDGTRVLTHFFKKNNARYEVKQLYERWYKDRVQNENIEEMFFPFGFGDGGGGATRDMLETVKRTKDLEGIPRTRQESPVSFFERLEKSGTDNVYRGELYLPWHRGTYTSQARLKRLNRRAENSLREADMWNAIGLFLDNETVPEDVCRRMEELWKRHLFLQFHDILPGTSIERVNNEAEREWSRIIEEADENAVSARKKIAEACGANYAGALWNSLSWERYDASSESVIPPCGILYAVKDKVSSGKFINTAPAVCSIQEETGNPVLENQHLRAVLDRRGRLISCIVKDESGISSEFISEPANELKLYKDINIAYDAWELATFYKDEEIAGAASDVTLVDFGSDGTAAYAEFSYRLSESTVRQRIELGRGAKRIDFVTEVDWRECHKLLRVDFPTTVYGGEVISEIQYGYIKRPAHRSKQSDKDRFEGIMHRFEALSESGRGAAVLNDSKYGGSAEDNVLSISLLKAAKIPDMNADMGLQEFTYSFCPYIGEFAGSGVLREAAGLNTPVLGSGTLINREKEECREGRSFINAEGKNVVIDYVKTAEDGSGDMIIRLYESVDAHESCVVKTTLDYSDAVLCDMQEKYAASLNTAESRAIELDFKPFEVKTLRLIRNRH